MPEVPFETWRYCPAYLPEGYGFAMAANSEKLDEPLIFVLPWSRTPNWEVPEHPNGAQRLTKVSFAGHTPSPSGVITAFLGLGLVWPEDGVDPLLRIVFDHGARGERHDLRPHLPLALTW